MKLPPSAAAVYWLLSAKKDKLREYTTTELVEISMLKPSTFFDGLRRLKADGLVREDRNALHLVDVTPRAEK